MSASNAVRVAAAQYPIEFLGGWQDYQAKLSGYVGEAAKGGAQIAMFPEYGSMELVSLLPEEVRPDLAKQLDKLQGLFADYLDLHADLAAKHGMYLLASSFPVRRDDGTYRNQAWLIGPGGKREMQEKLQMTRFEDEIWGIAPGTELRVFDTAHGRLGIAICYDSEFPRLVRGQIEAGAEIMLVPSCTDALPGYNRVRVAARARAMENQCFAVQSPTVGTAPWSAAVDENCGAAGAFGPIDRGFPSDGVLATGELNQPGWVYADLDLEAARTLRRETAQVFNSRDWAKEEPILRAPVRVGKV
ncbi:MAG: carbon-nitrogen hydrolase family protein [Alphaproteobacteria bacterium]|nr:carbon-nitrogen hydrolase family protein [Alphaproteobacteria bacterium]